MRYAIFALLFIITLPSTAKATRIHTVIKEMIRLAPNETVKVKIKATKNTNVGWEVKQSAPCKDNCIEAKQANNKHAVKFATQHGGSLSYTPVNGKIIIEYKNISKHDVSIHIYTEKNICDNEACDLLKDNEIAYPFNYSEINLDWKRARLAEIYSVEDSKDESYSRIKGKTIFGTKFELIAVWWFIERPQWVSMCKDWIVKNGHLEKNAAQSYQFSGSYIDLKDTPIMFEVGCSKMAISDKEDKDL